MLLGSAQHSAAADACNDAARTSEAKVDSAYLPKIDLLLKVAQALRDKGLDPRKYPVVLPNGDVEVLDLVELAEKAVDQRAEAFRQISAGASDCERGLKPYQDVVNLGVFFATGGLSAIMPAHMTNIDVSQILNGHPLGGDAALIPKMRDDILNGLGVGGDVGRCIRDPLHCIR